MALSLTSQWTLVACGIVAHADGVLDGTECDRLMTIVDHEVDGDEYATWLATVSDGAELESLLRTLEIPPADTHRQILEEAWTLSIADGDQAEVELKALERIASRLGVERVQLDFWKDAWTAAQKDLAETVTGALAWVLGGDGKVPTEDRRIVEEVVWQLPTPTQHRERLVRTTTAPHDAAEVKRRVSALNRRKRNWLLHMIAPAVTNASRNIEAQGRFERLAEDAGLQPEEAAALIRGS